MTGDLVFVAFILYWGVLLVLNGTLMAEARYSVKVADRLGFKNGARKTAKLNWHTSVLDGIILLSLLTISGLALISLHFTVDLNIWRILVGGVGAASWGLKIWLRHQYIKRIYRDLND